MKIQKSSDSEIFNQYSKTMQKFLIKRASWTSEILSELASGAKPLTELLTSTGKNLEDFILQLSKEGKSADEIAQLTGKNADEVKNIVSPAMEAVEQVVKNDIQAIEESSQSIINEGKTVSNLAQTSGDLEGKSLDEVIGLYQGIQRSRNSLKGQITKLKKELAKAQEAAQISTEEIAKKEELIRAGEQLLKNSEDEVIGLTKKIEELGGQLDQAGNAIKSLEGNLTSTKQELGAAQEALTLAQQAILDLEKNGVALDVANKKLIEEAVKLSESAGYYKKLYEEAKAIAPNSLSTKVAEQAAIEAEKTVIRQTQKISETAPAAAQEVSKVVQQSKANGSQKAVKAIQNAEAQAAKSATIPATKSAPISTTKPKPGQTTVPKSPSEIGDSEKSLVSIHNHPAIKPSKESFLQKLILKNSGDLFEKGSGLFGMAASGGVYLLKFAALATLITGAYLLWKSWYASEPTAQKQVDDSVRAQYQAIGRLKALTFQAGSDGEAKTQDLIVKLSDSAQKLNSLKSQQFTNEEYMEAMQSLDATDEGIKDYLESEELIKNSLTNPEALPSAISSLKQVALSLNTIKQSITERAQNQENQQGNNRAVTSPEARIGIPPGETENTPDLPQGSAKSESLPQIVQIYDQEVDLSKSSRGLRSAATRIIQKVMNTPEGKAFVDPDNIWGGWLPKTTMPNEAGEIVENKNNDFARALKYLYLNQIFDLHDLKKFIRKNLPKAGRKRLSGWKNAVKHYSGSLARLASEKNNKNFTQKFTKSANNNTRSVNSRENIIMNKKADQISKEYFQDAIKDLEDQYAKSYYTGLKGMYDNKLSATDSDFKNLYQIHNESGFDLIQKAHPKTIDIADAMGRGGVVENLVEQHRANTEIALSMPSGNFRNRHAWVIESLVKLANLIDENGSKEASDLIDVAIEEIMSL